VLLLVVAFIIIGVITGLLLLSARSALARGVGEMRQAETALRMERRGQSPLALLDQASQNVASAQRDFHTADDRLTPLAPLLRELGWLPRVGDEVATAPAAAQVADQMTDGLLQLLRGLRPVATGWGTHTTHRAMQVLVRRLATGRPDFEQASTLFESAQSTRGQISSAGHSPSIRSALRAVDRQLPGLVTLSRTLVLVPDLLGLHKPLTYLVVYQNSAELRATGGFIGSFGLLTLTDGVPTQRFMGSGIGDNLSIPPPEPVAYYNHELGWLLRDANWSPNFPTTAALERFFLKLDVHQDAAGVVNVTPRAAADILTATGRIFSPEYGRWITGQNVVGLADYYEHYAPRRSAKRPSQRGTRGKQFIGIVASRVLQHLGALSPAQWLRLGQSISSGVAHGDILINLRGPRAQALVRSAGASGEVSRATSDFLSVVDTNLSYNKINPYVHLSVGYDARIRRDRWLQSRLTVHFWNAPAPAALAQTGIGPGAGSLGKSEDYASFVRVYVPAGAQLTDQAGWTQPWSPGTAYGKTMLCGYVIVPAGQTRTITLSYIVPPNVFGWSQGTRYRLLVPHQPGSHPDSLRVSVTDEGGHAASWVVARPALDWQQTVPIVARPFSPIPLSRSPSTVVAPGHWIEPHAYLAAPDLNGPFLSG
jgi:Protein of unknown function (DUF4012)